MVDPSGESGYTKDANDFDFDRGFRLDSLLAVKLNALGGFRGFVRYIREYHA